MHYASGDFNSNVLTNDMNRAEYLNMLHGNVPVLFGY